MRRGQTPTMQAYGRRVERNGLLSASIGCARYFWTYYARRVLDYFRVRWQPDSAQYTVWIAKTHRERERESTLVFFMIMLWSGDEQVRIVTFLPSRDYY